MATTKLSEAQLRQRLRQWKALAETAVVYLGRLHDREERFDAEDPGFSVYVTPEESATISRILHSAARIQNVNKKPKDGELLPKPKESQ
jgi:hypothetical protein